MGFCIQQFYAADPLRALSTLASLLCKGVQLHPIGGVNMRSLLHKLWLSDEGQDIAEYAVMLAVILVLVVGTVRLVGSNANNAFSSVASSLQ